MPAARPRSRFEIALENTIEGCVREMLGAHVAALQARSANNAAIRTAILTIATDEAEHAALAHDLAAWLEPQLTA